MHQLLDVRPWPQALLRYPLLILTAFLLGALMAFAYSYAPLHNSKDWEIDYLKERLAHRSAQVRELEAEMKKTRASLEGTASDEEVQALRKQLAEATKLADSRKKEIGSLEKKVDSASRSRDTWKKRHAAAMKEFEQAGAQAEPAPAAPAAPAAAAPREPGEEFGDPRLVAPLTNPSSWPSTPQEPIRPE